MSKFTVDKTGISNPRDHRNNINVKSKRKRYLFKKAIELSQMKELRIFIMVRDLHCDRITTYCSGKEEDKNLFTFE